jgi:hypothetical protein
MQTFGGARMANDKATMGLPQIAIKNHKWDISIKRILSDMRSDFIYAPHLQYVFRYAPEEVSQALQKRAVRW